MQWIKVEHRLPKHGEIILVIDEISEVISLAKFREFNETMNFDDDCFEVMNMNEIEVDYSVTHWMKLPQSPKTVLSSIFRSLK